VTYFHTGMQKIQPQLLPAGHFGGI